MAATPLRRTDSAFTLVELLVSSIVLVLLVLTVVGMVNAVAQGTSANRRHLDADADARRVFDRIGNDLARMLKRPDADSIFASLPETGPDGTTGTNDKMFFYSEAPAYFDLTSSPTPDPSSEGTANLIGYRISTDNWQLERLGKGLTWDGASASPSPGGAVYLTYPPATIPTAYPTPTPSTPFPESTLAGHWPAAIGTAPTYDDGADPDYYHVLSSYVFRLEYCFALKNPVTVGNDTYYYLADQAGNAAIHAAFTNLKLDGFSNVSSVVVAVALLDPQGRQLIPGTPAGQPPDLSKLVSALPDPTLLPDTASGGSGAPSVKLMAELWNKKLTDGTFATDAGIPPSLASQVRVYQRFFPLNTANPPIAASASATP